VLVQRRRADSRAALRLMRKLLKEQGFAPRLLVTDKLRSYASAFRRPRLTCPHEQGLRGNNRAENSHQAVQRRERNSICITTATRWPMSSAARSPSRLHQPKAHSNPTARQPHNQISSAPSCMGGGGGAICGAIGGAPAGPQPDKIEEVITSLAQQIDLLVVWRIAAFAAKKFAGRSGRSAPTLRSTWRGLETWHGIALNRRASPRPYH
jgi:hypothetical protein